MSNSATRKKALAVLNAVPRLEDRLVAVTGLGAGDSRGHGGLLYDGLVFPLLLKRVYDDKDVQEWIIRSSELEWTIVRPGLLTSGPVTGRYRVLTKPQKWPYQSR